MGVILAALAAQLALARPRRRLRGLALALLTLIAVSPAHAEPRVALVIGNNAYREVPRLTTAVNDARAMARELEQVGFEVLLREDVDRRAMNRAVEDFVAKIAGGVGLLFYAGHGVQIGGTNYLLPIDIPKDVREADVPNEAVELTRVLERVASANAQFNLAIIDACRDNPFPRTAGRSIGGTRGLTQTAASGVLIVYSAGINEQAIDNLGPSDRSPNGLFTRKFLPIIRQPGLSATDAVRRVRDDVRQTAATIGMKQNPAIYDQATGDFYFVPKGATVTVTPPGTPPPGFDERQVELAFWDSVKGATEVAYFEDYLARYPNGAFAPIARRRIEELRRGGQQAAVTPAATSLGCFKDPNSPFDLDGFLERSRQNTPERCVAICASKGFRYAGVQYGESCLCGNSYGRFGAATNCNMACTGSPGQVCGGYNANSVYATGR